MVRETLIYLNKSMNSGEKNDLILKMNGSCGNCSPSHKTEKPRMMFVAFEEEKVGLRQIPEIMNQFGVTGKIVDL